ncbi:hypothetical protein JKP88DRAFT_283241 [Tribonema minus]|uniref:Uncharacterized protein n=1 Tax=Tribonema minus TaxID=303371 RepID=A0A835YL80_9STRA|nr:hypothetical protein JKP88DRAFT_283241 [Tribonema minus]
MGDAGCEQELRSRVCDRTSAWPGSTVRHVSDPMGSHLQDFMVQGVQRPLLCDRGGTGTLNDLALHHGRKLLEPAVATEYASRMSVPGGARPKALKGIALARLRSALSAALHMAYSGRVMTHTAESTGRGGGHMEEDVGEDPEMSFGGGGV